ncbi:hypothetical protein B0H16DRAFT_432452 [Mycena metata]|uniref:Uncharacterized protein n=1 Tax=Mycena metata TaxID=1033252 RepID=A0AAD7NKV5_9AGAR|nr:hypothetical protein B0H16DRAFT_432452 [Mycena metata]
MKLVLVVTPLPTHPWIRPKQSQKTIGCCSPSRMIPRERGQHRNRQPVTSVIGRALSRTRDVPGTVIPNLFFLPYCARRRRFAAEKSRVGSLSSALRTQARFIGGSAHSRLCSLSHAGRGIKAVISSRLSLTPPSVMAPTLGSPKFHIDIEDYNDDANLETLDTLRALHLKMRAFEAQIQAEKEAFPHIPRIPAKKFAPLGRGIHKVVATFGSIEGLIAEHDRRQELELARLASTVVLPEEPDPTDDQDRAFNGYKALIRFVPALRKALVEAPDDELAEIIAALRTGARNARSDDTKNLKSAIVPWLQRMFPKMVALDADSREERGIYNDDFGHLLCPTEYDWLDEITRSSIREGNPEYAVTAGSWWNGLYPNGKCDPDDPEKGLFRGHLLIMTWKFIFTSPISVKNMPDINSSSPPSSPFRRAPSSPSQRTPSSPSPRTPSSPSRRERRKAAKQFKKQVSTPKRSVAAILGLTQVTGRSIGYAAVQLRVALSDQHHWEDMDGHFDYKEFYNNIVDYFEFPPGRRAEQRVAQLLDFWNTNVFHHPTQWSLYTGSSRPQGSVEVMRAAAIAREAETNE